MARRPRRPNLTHEQLEELEAQFYLCRGPIKHQWEHIIASKDQRPAFGTLALFRCANCTSERHDVFSRITGALLARWYEYPEHYADTPRHGADWWRAYWAEQVYKDGKFLDSEVPTKKPGPRDRGKRAATGATVTSIKRKRPA